MELEDLFWGEDEIIIHRFTGVIQLYENRTVKVVILVDEQTSLQAIRSGTGYRSYRSY